MKKKKMIISIIFIVILVVACIGMVSKKVIEKGLNDLAVLPITSVDLSSIGDGTYIGSYKVFPIAAEVKVVVKEHRIELIELTKHENGQGSAAEIIPEKVVKAQNLQVDIVSGATYSSKVILKAIENALDSANNN